MRGLIGPAVRVLVVTLGDVRVAFRLEDVHEVLPAAEAAALADAPPVVKGLLNLRGDLLPILDLRVRIGLPTCPADPENHVLVCRVGGRAVGVWVDRAEDVREIDGADIAPLDGPDTGRHFEGAAMVADGVLLVSDVESFLSAGETQRLEEALAGRAEVSHGR